MIAPFWPFGEKMNRLTFKPRGTVLRELNPDYDGIFDDIDAKYNTEVARRGDLHFEISDNDSLVRADCTFQLGKFEAPVLSWYADLPTRQEAYAWCEGKIDEAQAKSQELLDVSAKFEPGFYLAPQWHDGWLWSIVRLTMDDSGVAKVRYFGWEVEILITNVEWQMMEKLPPITAPDGQIVGS